MPKDELSRFAASRGEDVTCVTNALILPARKQADFTIVDANGAPVADALTFRKTALHHSHFVDRDRLAPAQKLSGRYLYAGDYWLHFGHFLFESLSRLWALDHIDAPLDGIVFLSPRGHTAMRAKSVQAQLLAMLGIDLPVILITQPTEIETLYVPRQACSMGALASGTPAARRFFRDRFHRIPPRSGADKIYITRSGYRNQRGGLFAEGLIEENLVAQGYTLFSPERASVADQIATYRGARQIVSPDSSALHLFGFVGTPAQDLAIVLRRTDGAVDMLPQITGFTGRKPLVIDAISRILSRNNARNPSWGQFAELDLDALGQHLAAAGFIQDLALWRRLKPWQARNIRARMEAAFDCALTETEPLRA